VTGSEDFTLNDFDTAISLFTDDIDLDKVEVACGLVYDPSIGDGVRMTVLLTSAVCH